MLAAKWEVRLVMRGQLQGLGWWNSTELPVCGPVPFPYSADDYWAPPLWNLCEDCIRSKGVNDRLSLTYITDNIGSYPSSSYPSTSLLSLKYSLSFNHTNGSACNTDFGMTWAVLVLQFSSCITLDNLFKLTEFPFPHLKSRVYNTHFFRRLSWELELVYIKNLEQSQIYTK